MCAKPIIIDGAYADLFNDFIEFKRSIGYGYPKQTLESIRCFSRFILQFPLSEFVLTEEIVNEFKKPKPSESTITRNMRASLARQFALYLESRGIDCYVPPEQREKEDRGFVPRIITENEMSRILKYADSLTYRVQTPKYNIIWVST